MQIRRWLRDIQDMDWSHPVFTMGDLLVTINFLEAVRDTANPRTAKRLLAIYSLRDVVDEADERLGLKD